MIRVNVNKTDAITLLPVNFKSMLFESIEEADVWIAQEMATWEKPEDYSVEKFDVTAQMEEDLALQKAKARQQVGADVLAKLALINAAKNMDQQGLLELLADAQAAIIERLLWGGALATAKAMIEAYSGSIYDEADKAALIKIIDDSGLI